MVDENIPGASAWEHELFAHLQAHIRSEERAQEDYRKIAAATEESDVRFLIELILEDEVRHHGVLGQIVGALRSLVEGGQDTPIPLLAAVKRRPDLLAATQRFVAAERQDLKELRRLLKDLGPVDDTTLWALMVRLLVFDTRKHIEILRFIGRRASG